MVLISRFLRVLTTVAVTVPFAVAVVAGGSEAGGELVELVRDLAGHLQR